MLPAVCKLFHLRSCFLPNWPLEGNSINPTGAMTQQCSLFKKGYNTVLQCFCLVFYDRTDRLEENCCSTSHAHEITCSSNQHRYVCVNATGARRCWSHSKLSMKVLVMSTRSLLEAGLLCSKATFTYAGLGVVGTLTVGNKGTRP